MPHIIKPHDCTVLERGSCTVCENYFWKHVAEHNEDDYGLEIFLQSRGETIEEARDAVERDLYQEEMSLYQN